MRTWFASALLLVVAGVASRQIAVHAQTSDMEGASESQNVRTCSLPVAHAESGPELVVAYLTFEGNMQLPISDQEQIATSLKQQTYSSGPDGSIHGLSEMVREAWQNYGYFTVKVHSTARVLNSSPISEWAAVTVHVDEGEQYRLQGITFRNNKAITDVQALRSLFPLQDGDILSREKIAEGLEELRRTYGQFGYLNLTVIPTPQLNEDDRTVSFELDFDEGKQFFVSRVSVLGLDGGTSEQLLRESLLKRGDIYNERLAHLFLQKHAMFLPPGTTTDSHMDLQLNERGGTVAITYDFRPCVSN